MIRGKISASHKAAYIHCTGEKMKTYFICIATISLVTSLVVAGPESSLQEREDRSEESRRESNDETLQTGELTEDEFVELHAALLPGEKMWRTIPWQTSLIEAQRIAARNHKPLFIWAMDGHPLGCT